MPWAPAKHCPNGHPAFTGARCPACAAAAEARRPSARARGYNTGWEREARAFLAEHPTCIACGDRATVVDHATPHKGDRALFWNRANWQPMCAPCHSRKTARDDGGFGRPITPRGEVRGSAQTGRGPVGGLARGAAENGISRK